MHISRANGIYAYINVTILSAFRSRPLIQVSFHVHYFASYFDITHLQQIIERNKLLDQSFAMRHMSMSSCRWFDSPSDQPTLSRYTNKIT